MSKLFKKIIDYFVIISQISFHISIVPYIIFNDFEPFNLILLLNGVICLIFLYIRFGGKIYSIKKIINFPPISIFLILMFFQFLSGLAKMKLEYIGVGIVLSFNFIVFITYINNLFLSFKNASSEEAFTKMNGYYTKFTGLNVILVISSAILQIMGLLKPYSNSINEKFSNLLGSNVDSYTNYFMPGWLSIQTENSRLGFDFGNLTGLTHEPHVLSYLIFPAFFFLLGENLENKVRFYLIFGLFVLVGLFSFSVTSFLVLVILVLIKLLIDKNFFSVVVLLFIFLFLLINDIEIGIFEKIKAFIELKFNSSHSIDYSTNKIRSILLPNSYFGDGVLLATKKFEKNAGFFTAVFYVLFYISMFYYSIKLCAFKNKKIMYFGIGFLYFTLHSFKLSSSVFAMPITIYVITIMAINENYIIKNKNEGFKNN